MSQPKATTCTEVEQTVAACIMWEPVVGELLGSEFVALVARITERLVAQGWTPPASDSGSSHD